MPPAWIGRAPSGTLGPAKPTTDTAWPPAAGADTTTPTGLTGPTSAKTAGSAGPPLTAARGFRVSGRALDGVIEAIEAETDGWFGLGVQWQPGSATASGLDIQLFRGLVEACGRRSSRRGRAVQTAAA